MSAIGLQLPIQQFFSDDGAPLAGGFLSSFLAGTSTPTDTWLASTLTNPNLNSNPIELDASGRCVVYLSPSVSYKFILTDADEVPVWTQDNVSPAEVA